MVYYRCIIKELIKGLDITSECLNENAEVFMTYFKTHAYSYLDRKQKFNHLAKLTSLAKRLSVCIRTKWLCIQILLQSSKIQILHLF